MRWAAAIAAVTCVNALAPRMAISGWTTYINTSLDCNPSSPEIRCISAALYETMADVLVQQRYVDAGYRWIDINDGWTAIERDASGRLVADATRFSRGLAGVVASIQAKGLDVAMGIELGPTTCKHMAGSEGHYELDVQTLGAANVTRLLVHACSIASASSSFYFRLSTLHAIAKRHVPPLALDCVLDQFPVNASLVTPYCATLTTQPTLPDNWAALQVRLRALLALPPGDMIAHHPGGLLVGGYALTEGQNRLQLGIWLLLHAPLVVDIEPWAISNRTRALLQQPLVTQLTLEALMPSPPELLGSLANGIQIWRRAVVLHGKVMTLLLALRLDVQEPQYNVPLVFELSDVVDKTCDRAILHDVYGESPPVAIKYRFTLEIAPMNAYLVLLEPTRR
ncbi:hypothetical protein SDRG_02225 [Saprolegnia diclina VS20]|uniref:Alpha-galactosidase n=1 Tax=Saprolegnia diclina (strain VS20) TaxID=1156394 RepID=T0QQB2_SAPDV|nr:hypothetical protein SDRG_02225 [Saprolegnia diclina VS20]EQC40324.1 hypothetical protein SDRG_02225 [Saprolegnia diclina VS20]|eukprot:XP_008606023.1 hypothetical protein SDRG_02225 [Saprolegnia diclina VS20]